MKTKDFLKLKQNDRIEYILRLNRIEDKNKSSCLLVMIKWFFVYTFLIIILDLLLYIATGDFHLMQVLFQGWRYNIWYAFIIISFCIDLLSVVLEHKQTKELFNEFFKAEEVKAK